MQCVRYLANRQVVLYKTCADARRLVLQIWIEHCGDGWFGERKGEDMEKQTEEAKHGRSSMIGWRRLHMWCSHHWWGWAVVAGEVGGGPAGDLGREQDALLHQPGDGRGGVRGVEAEIVAEF